MPELPEVETVARGLAAAVEGRMILRAEARRPDLRFPLPPDLSARLEGRRLERIARRAKYMLLHLDDGTVMILHLGMSGRLLILNGEDTPLGRHDHVIFTFEGGIEVRFNDVRRFGMLDLCAESALETHPLLRDIGPEPLGNDFNGPALAAALKGRRTPIKAALLDQRTVAGLGNIYVCEALFRAGISPRRLAATVQGKRAENLAAAVKSVLTDAIASGGSSLRDYVQPSGELGYFQHQWAVYGREGEACPGCDCAVAETGGVARIVQSGRSTFYCSRRQR
ncbi:MAG TPA: bifunctional DNA-formamidopyrimidine glycosylase/DNA-(apurinic or apyrimidinic site) lyase [Alphaproteobacteria bacterium]|nr:bifunctional DNA-formamidopyrimidine glycosylase/DNA-(apurinic or apyrimidinic site) lyase [Alphaproteobacteria bacterium]